MKLNDKIKIENDVFICVKLPLFKGDRCKFRHITEDKEIFTSEATALRFLAKGIIERVK